MAIDSTAWFSEASCDVTSVGILGFTPTRSILCGLCLVLIDARALDRLAYLLAKLVAFDCSLRRVSLHLGLEWRFEGTMLPTAHAGPRFTPNLPRGRRIA